MNNIETINSPIIDDIKLYLSLIKNFKIKPKILIKTRYEIPVKTN